MPSDACQSLGRTGRRAARARPAENLRKTSPIVGRDHPIRRVEGRRRQTVEGSRAGELHTQTPVGRCGVGEGGAQGDRQGGILSPARRRAAVDSPIGRWGQSAVRLPGDRGRTVPPNAAHPPHRHLPIPTPRCDSGCVNTPEPIRGADSRAPTTTPAARAGRSTTRKSNASGATKDCACHNHDAVNASASPPPRWCRPRWHRTLCGRSTSSFGRWLSAVMSTVWNGRRSSRSADLTSRGRTVR